VDNWKIDTAVIRRPITGDSKLKRYSFIRLNRQGNHITKPQAEARSIAWLIVIDVVFCIVFQLIFLGKYHMLLAYDVTLLCR